MTRPTYAERNPFPPASRPFLEQWAKLAAEISLRHGDSRTRVGLNGLGDPAGPRQWRDDWVTGYKAFLVYFLPVGEKLINHNLAVEFGVNGQVLIYGSNHVGRHFEMKRTDYTPETFDADLRTGARFVGLLPEATS